MHSTLCSILGEDISDDDAMSAHQKLDSFIDRNEVDRLLGKIKNSVDEQAFNAVEFGPALAIAHAINRPLSYSITVMHRNNQLAVAPHPMHVPVALSLFNLNETSAAAILKPDDDNSYNGCILQ